jgi:nitrate reductase cytochrome c-type subunit
MKSFLTTRHTVLLLLLLLLLGTVAANSGKKGKGKSGRGKKGRMTEEEEDAQMLKSAQSKRRVIRLDKQPSILADHCKMHGYQLEGLNWLIKLHCNGINGILADEVRIISFWVSFWVDVGHPDNTSCHSLVSLPSLVSCRWD